MGRIITLFLENGRKKRHLNSKKKLTCAVSAHLKMATRNRPLNGLTIREGVLIEEDALTEAVRYLENEYPV